MARITVVMGACAWRRWWDGWFLQIVRPGHAGCAELVVLRRRTYLRALPLPGGRALIVGRLCL